MKRPQQENIYSTQSSYRDKDDIQNKYQNIKPDFYAAVQNNNAYNTVKNTAGMYKLITTEPLGPDP